MAPPTLLTALVLTIPFSLASPVDRRGLETNINEPPHAKQHCFFPSGSVMFGEACVDGAAVSNCCGYGFTCMSNGLCQTSPMVQKNMKATYYRSACTDRTWASGNCTRVCTGPRDELDASNGLEVCDEDAGVYCCQKDDGKCCDDPALHITLGPGKPIKYEVRPTSVPSDELVAAPSPPSNHTSSPPPPQSSSPSPSMSASPREGSSGGQDNVAGVLVGFATAVMFFVGSWTVWICRSHRVTKKRRQEEAEARDQQRRALERLKTEPKELDAVDSALSPPVEMDGQAARGWVGSGVELEAVATPASTMVASPVSWTTERSAGTVGTVGTIGTIGTLVTEEIVEMEAPSGQERRNSCEKIGLG